MGRSVLRPYMCLQISSWLRAERFGGVVFGAEEDVENDERGAYGDGGIGYVKGGVVVIAEADFEEVGDGAVKDAVGDVTCGAAEKEREAGGGHGATGVSGGEEPG